MAIEPCYVCEGEADIERIKVDLYDVRCEKCGKYIFHNGIHEGPYKGLSEQERERISKYIKDFNEETNEWPILSDIDELRVDIDKFYRYRNRN